MKFLDCFIDFFARIAAFFCFVLVLITVEQVLARYLLNDSSVALQELEWHLFSIIFLFAAAKAYKNNAHVRVDIFSAKFSHKQKAWLETIGILFFLLPMCGIIIFYGTKYTLSSFQYQNPHPLDFYTNALFTKDSFLYTISAFFEYYLRKTILIGEISPDTGGLEARWLIKAAMPFGFFLLALQALQILGHNIKIIAAKSIGEKNI